MTSLYAAIAPHFTQDLLTPELKVGIYDEGGSWPFVAASLAQRLPLRGIEWKNLVGATKSIDELPLTFVAQSELEALPLVCIYLVKCEDMDYYRAGAKARLAAWIDRMNAARVEWMVLYIPLGTRTRASSSRSAATANHAVYKKIFDKIRSDFAHRRPNASTNSSSSASSTGASVSSSSNNNNNSNNATHTNALNERICKIEILEGNSIVGAAPGQHQQHEAQWSELLLRLRHCIMDAFQIKCYQYEEEVRVLDTKRTMSAVGWDFGAFFLAKERLALMYQQTHLLDDAIRHFDELDAIFINLSAGERRLLQDVTDDDSTAATKRSSFHADDAIFTVAPLALDLAATQQAIASNRASIQVIQLHCFIRQLRALFLLGSFPQLLARATAFIASFVESLPPLPNNPNSSSTAGANSAFSQAQPVAQHQAYQWAVGACLEIAYACELSWSGQDVHETSASAAAQTATSPEVMARHLGDMLYLARRLLVRFTKLLPTSDDAVQATSGSTSNDNDDKDNKDDDPLDAGSTTDRPHAWYKWLARMFAAPRRSARLERCVWEMSHLASLHYSRAGRHRFAVFLGAECAQYHLRHCEYESASRLLRSLARQCEEDKWWRLVSNCARNICHAELALGRAAEAVTACLSLLASAPDARSSNDDNSHQSGREYMDEVMQTLVQSLQTSNATTKLRMGELLRPTLAIETMHTASTTSDLVHGDVHVSLCIANSFPAGIHLDKLRVQFTKVQQRKHATTAFDGRDGNDSEDGDDATRSLMTQPSAGDTFCLDSLVLDDDTSATASTLDSEATTKQRREQGLTQTAARADNANRLVDALPRLRSADAATVAADMFVLEARDVYLSEHASVTRVFARSGLAVGTYVCSSIDCVIAGNTFRLLAIAPALDAPAESPAWSTELPPSLQSVSATTTTQAEAAAGSLRFQIPRRESTLCVAVQGPPLLTPQSIEKLCVTVSAQSDTVADGVLELTAATAVTDGGNCDCSSTSATPTSLVQFLAAELQMSHVASASPPTQAMPRSKLLLSLPSLVPGETLVYRVWVRVSDTPEGDDVVASSMVAVVATVRYQFVAGSETNTALRRTDAVFRVLRPLTERVRLQRVDASRIVVAVALTCTSISGVVVRDYRLVFSHDVSCKTDSSEDRPAALPSSRRFAIASDRNAQVRNVRLQRGETIHVAFTLLDTSSLDRDCDMSTLPTEAQLLLDLYYDAAEGLANVKRIDAEQPVKAPFPQQPHWTTALAVRIPLAAVCGAHFRIDVEPRANSRDAFAIGDEIVFRVTVRELHATSTLLSAPMSPQLLLCLDDCSERDWILLGKQRERVELGVCTDSSNIRDRSNVFVTHKRFLSTRVGRLRFPSFHLRVSGSGRVDMLQLPQLRVGEEAYELVASERVLLPQRAMQVLVM